MIEEDVNEGIIKAVLNDDGSITVTIPADSVSARELYEGPFYDMDDDGRTIPVFMCSEGGTEFEEDDDLEELNDLREALFDDRDGDLPASFDEIRDAAFGDLGLSTEETVRGRDW